VRLTLLGIVLGAAAFAAWSWTMPQFRRAMHAPSEEWSWETESFEVWTDWHDPVRGTVVNEPPEEKP